MAYFNPDRNCNTVYDLVIKKANSSNNKNNILNN